MDYCAYADAAMSVTSFKSLLSKLVPTAIVSDYYAVASVYRISLDGISYDIPYCRTEKELREHLLLAIPEYFL